MKSLIEMGKWAEQEFGWPNEKPDIYNIGYVVAEEVMDHILDMLVEEGPEWVAERLHEEVYKKPLPTDHLQQILEKQ